LQNTTNSYCKNLGYLAYPNYITGIPIQALLPLNEEDSLSKDKKTIIHQICNLPLDRPFLRENDSILNSKTFNDNYQSSKLKDVHLGLPTRTVEGGKRYLIHGSYVYHHYLHDFNDKGWGCAYRSLQTLVSWFKEQRYSSNDCEVPSIPKIQEILIEMGDKQSNFKGSQDWIGAFEVSLVLNKLLDVESKIMYIPNGADVGSYSRQLRDHFISEGTPVMIGGGVLAYTLLGIDYNEDTGETKYLILDPHYTGADNLKSIQEKGWISWKDEKIFLEGSYYNFCLPQRKKFI